MESLLQSGLFWFAIRLKLHMFGLVRAVRATSRTRTSHYLSLQYQVGTQSFGEVVKQTI